MNDRHWRYPDLPFPRSPKLWSLVPLRVQHPETLHVPLNDQDSARLAPKLSAVECSPRRSETAHSLPPPFFARDVEPRRQWRWREAVFDAVNEHEVASDELKFPVFLGERAAVGEPDLDRVARTRPTVRLTLNLWQRAV